MNIPILAVENLTVRIAKRTIVDDVTFALNRHEICALIGPNGAGKSTLLNVISGHLKPHKGRVFLNGKRIDGVSPARLPKLGLSRTFQIAAGFQSLTAAESIAVPLRSLSAPVAPILKKFGLKDVASKLTMELSYGDMKKLDLAIAMATNPSLLLLDEPTAGIGAGERQDLLEIVQESSVYEGLTVLFCEHDTDLVFAFAKRVLVMHQGRLIAEGAPDEVRGHPDVIASYLGGPA